MKVWVTARLCAISIALIPAGCEDQAFERQGPYPEPTLYQIKVAASECGVKDWSYTADYLVIDGLPDGPRLSFRLAALPEDRVEVAKGVYLWDYTKRAEAKQACLEGIFARMKVSAQFGSLQTQQSWGPDPVARK